MLPEYKNNGNVEERNSYFNSCMPMIIKIAKRFSNKIQLEELVQEGVRECLEALDEYSSRPDVFITSYLYYRIFNALNLYERIHSRRTPAPDYTGLGRIPTAHCHSEIVEIAEKYNRTYNYVRDYSSARMPYKETGDFIWGSSTSSPIDEAISLEEAQQLDKVVKGYIKTHPLVMRRIEKYFVEEKKMRQIGEEEGVDSRTISMSIQGLIKYITKQLGE